MKEECLIFTEQWRRILKLEEFAGRFGFVKLRFMGVIVSDKEKEEEEREQKEILSDP